MVLSRSFSAKGLNKSVSRVLYRVTEVGNAEMKIRFRAVDFKQEVSSGDPRDRRP